MGAPVRPSVYGTSLVCRANRAQGQRHPTFAAAGRARASSALTFGYGLARAGPIDSYGPEPPLEVPMEAPMSNALARATQSLLRIMSGLLFIFPGSVKILGWFGGMPAGFALTPLLRTAGWMELVGGTLILLGLWRWRSSARA